MEQLRVLVVDDSAMYRLALKAIVSEIDGAKYIGSAVDGVDALEKIKTEKPDIVTLDMDMPLMSGMDVIKRVGTLGLNIKIIIVSATSKVGATKTIEALGYGAYDFITKPHSSSGGSAQIKCQLKDKISLICKEQILKPVINIERTPSSARQNGLKPGPRPRSVVQNKENREPEEIVSPRSVGTRIEAVVIGSSTGGPKALTNIFSGLTEKLRCPIYIVQHMPPLFTKSLAKSLNEVGPISVKEAEECDIAQPGYAYVAPGGRQMKLVSEGGRKIIRLTDDILKNPYKPSVDYLMMSVAREYGAASLGVILSGMGSDGCEGLAEIKNVKGRVIGQDKESCVVYGMPKAAMERGLVDKQLGLEDIGREIAYLARV